MRTELPAVTPPGYRLIRNFAGIIGRILLCIAKIGHQAVEFGGLKAGDAEVEVEFGKKGSKFTKLSCKNIAVPARVRSDLVVGDRESTLFSVA